MSISISAAWLIMVILISARLAVVFFATPLDAFGRVPTHIKLLLSLALSVALVSALSVESMFVHQNLFQLGISFVNELLIGLLMAFGLYCSFGAAMLGGRLLDLQAGFGAANVLDPTTSSHSPLLGTALTLMLTAVFFVSDAYLLVIRGLAFSIGQVPPGAALNSFDLQLIIKQFGVMFGYGLALAAPVMAALLLLDTAIAVMSRSMPQMNVYFLFLPLKLFLALVLVALSLRYVSPLIEQLFLSAFLYLQRVLV